MHKHLLSIESLNIKDIEGLFRLANGYLDSKKNRLKNPSSLPL